MRVGVFIDRAYWNRLGGGTGLFGLFFGTSSDKEAPLDTTVLRRATGCICSYNQKPKPPVNLLSVGVVFSFVGTIDSSKVGT